MKKYRIKEEYRNIVKVPNIDAINELEYWLLYVQFDALEEVQQRIELEKIDSVYLHDAFLSKKIKRLFTDQEKDICEKALNGELEQEYCTDFLMWLFEDDYIQTKYNVESINWHYEQYLKQKK